ncbi:MAG TPA: gfo/Idh/MocA family oxidoreductase [Ruminococcaceae bacterium]|nr:gfo/Idh/MocA family oxidoreductase [Oscillospiraceae bacterium]
MSELKVAVIGCGSISCMHLDSAAALPQSEIVAVCDIKKDRAEAKASLYGCRAYCDYRDMLLNEKLDAVHLCLPHYLHIPAARYFINNGVNVISEKPMSIGYKEAEATVQSAESLNIKYSVVFQCRYNTPSVFVKQRIDNGRLGRVKCARVILTWCRQDNYYADSDWKGTWDKEGGGVVINQAIHSLDLANWFIGSDPICVQASLHNRNHKSIAVEDTAEGLIKYENGALLSFYTTNNYLIDEQVEIMLLCENGNARLSYNEAEIKYTNGETERSGNHPQMLAKYSSGKEYWGTGHAMQINNFYNSILGRERLEISGRDALKIQRLICDIYKSGNFEGKSI